MTDEVAGSAAAQSQQGQQGPQHQQGQPGQQAKPVQDPVRFREVLGHFASGVVIVAATLPDGPLGLTCQSFVSVSLDPPLISFTVSTTSKRYPRIREAGRFCVNVLSEEQEPLSRAFGRGGDDLWTDLEWTSSPLGSPVIAGSHAWIDCHTQTEVPAGDHVIVLGSVVDLGADSTRRPLVFYRGTYATLPSPRT
jgi:3-hydroxy-9,10-secoandrosta-1,3,5(10)-triene-9,17-dione monooxygenase reductase component